MKSQFEFFETIAIHVARRLAVGVAAILALGAIIGLIVLSLYGFQYFQLSATLKMPPKPQILLETTGPGMADYFSLVSSVAASANQDNRELYRALNEEGKKLPGTCDATNHLDEFSRIYREEMSKLPEKAVPADVEEMNKIVCQRWLDNFAEYQEAKSRYDKAYDKLEGKEEDLRAKQRAVSFEIKITAIGIIMQLFSFILIAAVISVLRVNMKEEN